MVDEKSQINIYEVAKKIIAQRNFITISELKKFFVYEEGVYLPKGESVVNQILVDSLKGKATKNLRNEIIEQIKIITEVSEEDINLELSDDYICVNNGILNAKTRKIIDHNPKYIFFSKLPVDYVKGVKCPIFENFIKEVVKPYEAEQLQEFVGYTLMTNTAKYEKGIILQGEGGRGKSTFLKIVTELLGKNNVTAFTLQQLQDKVILVELHGKIANISMDIPKDRLLNVEHIKSITSGDRITGRGLFKGPLTFVPNCKMMFSCNNLPEPTYGNDRAFFSRWVYIKFIGPNFREPDEFGIRKAIGDYDRIIVKKELSGILNWALEGYEMVNLTQFSDVDANETRIKWMRNSNNTMVYAFDRLVQTYDSNDVIKKRDVYSDYERYCKINQETPLSQRSFHPKLKELLGLEECHTKKNDTIQRPAWRGIKFKDGGI